MKRWLLGLATMLEACGGGGGFPIDAEPPPPPPKGKFSLAWTLTDTAGQTITCPRVGGTFVTVTLHNRALVGAETEVLACSSGEQGMTATSLLSFTPGTYDLNFELDGAVGTLSTAPPSLAIEINSNETATVPPITFAVDATGKMELFLATGAINGNCTGAGIKTTTISLIHSGAACEPVTFDISAGASQPAGTYTIDCTTAFNKCIDSDQKLSVSTMPSGNYQISVKGGIGATDCWTTASSLVVPPLSKTLMQTLNLTHQTTGC